jgi:hypothetical protein
VLLIQVIAHLLDLNKSLSNLRQLVRPDGRVLIETWNQESFTARLLGKRWHEYSPPSVLHWFTPQRLANLMREFGFEQETTGRTVKWISVRHALSLLQKDRMQDGKRGSSTRIPSTWKIPYPSEDLFWSLFRRIE